MHAFMDAIQQMPQEIRDMIIPGLSLHDLAIAARVCSSWHGFFSPFLWRTVRIHTSESLHRFMSAVLRGALDRNGHHIRILDLKYYEAVEEFAKRGQTCTGLLELTVDSNESPPYRQTASAPSTSTFSSMTFFGSASPFGSSAAFGSASPFGSSAAFGSASPFGSASGATFGSATGSGSGATFGSATGSGSGATVGLATPFGSASGAAFGSTTPSNGTGLSSITALTPGFGAPLSAISTPNTNTTTAATATAMTTHPIVASFGAAASATQGTSSPFTNSTFSFRAGTSATASPFHTALTPSTFGSGGVSPFSLPSYDAPASSTTITPAAEKAHSYFSHLVLILQRNKWLRSLTVKLLTGEHGVAAAIDFNRVLRSLPDSIESLILCPPVIRFLNWAVCLDTTQPPETSVQLSRLRMFQVTNALNTRTLCELLPRCIALEELRMNDAKFFAMEEVVEVMRKHCPRLTELFVIDRTISDEDLAVLLTASTAGWKSLGLGKVSQLGPLSVLRILESAPSLQNLWMDGITRFTSRDVQTLLKNAPHLTRLCALNEHQGALGYEIFLTAEDLLSSEWACCESLEILAVEITGVPRPELRVRTNGRPFSEEEMHAMSKDAPRISQEMIYERLGKLKNLRELVLGHDELMDGSNYGLYYRDRESELEFSNHNHIQIGYQYNCLDMSLASGLDRLRDLKEMRRVGLERMAVQFYNADEQAWARKVWPKFGQAVGGTSWEDRWKGPS